MKIKPTLLIGLLLFKMFLLSAQNGLSKQYNISYITMQDGLQHDFIDNIYKDSKGFIWFSTGGGLSRYDGFTFNHFDMSTSPLNLKGNFVHKVCEDDFNRLWIVSEGGLNILDLGCVRMIDLFLGLDEESRFFINIPALEIMKDSEGNMWLFSDKLYKIILNEKGDVKDIYEMPDKMDSVRLISLADIDDDGNVWAGYNDAVYKMHFTENNMLKPVVVSEKLRFESGTIIMKLFQKGNDVWIGTNYGLYRYGRNRDLMMRYSHDTENSASLSHNHVLDISISKSGELIAATLKGLNFFNSMSGEFEHISHDDDSGNNLSSDFINSILCDGEIIWLGSETGGVNKLYPKSSYIKSFDHHVDVESSISKNPVNSIFEDSGGNLWIGTVEGGLNLKKRGENKFQHFTTTSSTQLSHNSVSALVTDNKGRLWVGTWGYGISIIDPENPARKAMKYINSSENPGFNLNLVGVLCFDNVNDGMWIGSYHGLFFYDLKNEKMHAPFQDDRSSKIKDIIGAVIDREKKLWIGSEEGVYVIDLNSRKDGCFTYEHLKFKLDRPGSNLVEKIKCLCLDSDGVLWLGSDGFGVYKREIKEDKYSFVSYTMADGLPNNNIKGILEDDFGNLWISTNNGLSCFDKKEKFINYNAEDGTNCNQFYWNAYFKSEAGNLYFGTLNGLVEVNPEISKTKTESYGVVLTDFYVNNQKVNPGQFFEKNISELNKITLHEKYNLFSIDFSALNYKISDNYVYAYRLLGYDDNWTEVPKHVHSASFMNLPSAKYVFEVKYTPVGQPDFGEIRRLEIRIKPYFYKETWFTALVIVLLLIFALLWYRRRIKSYKSQQQKLKLLVDKRTVELEKKKGLLLQQKNELSEQNNILSLKNDEITYQKDQLEEMSRIMQRMNAEKIDFFTNISHEFRTPITLIAGPVERALKLSTNPYVIEQLNFAERNSKYLLSLINQLMDFRKIESNKFESSYNKDDFITFTESLISSFEFQAAERQITIRRCFSFEDPVFYFDDESLQKIVINLLSNAIKFTPNGGEITIYAKSLNDAKTEDEKLYLSVKDNGAGIPEGDVEKVFERFYQSSDYLKYPVYGQSGTGIGLYLIKQIVGMLGGEIGAKNNRRSGASFRVVLPLLRSNQGLMSSESELVGSVDCSDIEHESLAGWGKDKLTFLVVEDYRDMRNYICSVLSPHYNTLSAQNGVEALVVLEDSNVDFIVSDLMMPQMDGLEFSRKVKENFALSHIPFLMLTAKTSDKVRTESYRTGVDSYIVKPFNEEMLLTRIRNILESREKYQTKFNNQMSVDALEIDEESNDKKFMDRILETMKENYRNSYFEVGDFVEAMGVSKSLLNKKLNGLTGKSAGEFIRAYRLNLAYKLILQNKVTKNKNISDIAYEVGFNDPKYFSRCFSKHFEITPSKLMEG